MIEGAAALALAASLRGHGAGPARRRAERPGRASAARGSLGVLAQIDARRRPQAPGAPIDDDGRMSTVEEATRRPARRCEDAAAARRRRDGRAPLWLELAVIAWLFWLYDVINNLAPTRVALAHRTTRGRCSRSSARCTSTSSSRSTAGSAGHAVLAFIATY